jgi:hypothetical protein
MYVGCFLSLLVAIPEIGVVIGRTVNCSTLLAAPDSYCSKRNISIAFMTFTVVASFVDVFIYSIAIARLRGLHVNKTKRVQATAVFSMCLMQVSRSADGERY